jgi:hypothetical protein
VSECAEGMSAYGVKRVRVHASPPPKSHLLARLEIEES